MKCKATQTVKQKPLAQLQQSRPYSEILSASLFCIGIVLTVPLKWVSHIRALSLIRLEMDAYFFQQ